MPTILGLGQVTIRAIDDEVRSLGAAVDRPPLVAVLAHALRARMRASD